METTSFYYDIADRKDCFEPGDRHFDADEVADGRALDERPEIEIEFVYPLSTAVRRKFANSSGFTRADFAKAVSDGYEAIYAEEEASRTLSPEPSGMLLNRSRTDGVHGIWGHGIGDLTLEGAQCDADGVWHLDVGS